jgi:aryl-alcohol dehydrogenase-like predicted oxidoreductase
MQYRKFGRTGWDVSEIGYGMWGMGGVERLGRYRIAPLATTPDRSGLQFLRGKRQR